MYSIPSLWAVNTANRSYTNAVFPLTPANCFLSNPSFRIFSSVFNLQRSFFTSCFLVFTRHAYGSPVECRRSLGQRSRLCSLCLSLSYQFICIKESNLNSPSFRISRYLALQFGHICRLPGSLSSHDSHLNGIIVIFVRQGFLFSEFSTISLSSINNYFDYVGSSFLHKIPFSPFPKFYAPPIWSSSEDTRSDSFLPFILPPSKNILFLRDFNHL